METSDLNICRSMRYTKGWHKGAVKCTQCGFWFVPDSQKYPLYDGEPSEYLTGVQWFAQFKCCPNCQPAEPTAPFGKRRCLGKIMYGRGWTRYRGCGVFFVIGKLDSRMNKKGRLCHCVRCNPKSNQSDLACIAAISKCNQLVKRLGHVPTCAEFKASKLFPSISAVTRRFGTYNHFLGVCGLSQRNPGHPKNPNAPKIHTDKTVLDALHKAYIENGRAITVREWNQQSRKPCDNTIRDRFSGWSNAWKAIGVEPPWNLTDGSMKSRQFIYANIEKMNANHIYAPTAREMWQYQHGQSTEDARARVERYLAAIGYHAEKLAEQERIFKEHQFKSKDNIDTDSDS